MANNDFDDYFDSKIEYKHPFSTKDIQYCSNLENFYKNVIEPNIKELYEKNINNLLNWCNFIEKISDDAIPIYWVRKYESSTPYGRVIDEDGQKYSKTKKENNKYTRRWNTRRGALTIVIDENGKVQYGYIFVSNFDAQEIYNMVFNIKSPDAQTFLDALKSGNYCFHFDNDGSCIESDISYYKATGTTRGGVMTEAKWYLAHIDDVNGEYYNGQTIELSKTRKNKIQDYFPSGDSPLCVSESDIKATKWGVIKNWKEIRELEKDNRNKEAIKFLELSGKGDKSKRVRIIQKDSKKTNFDLEKRIFRAHFLRFIHPFNYFLVPSQSYIFNSIKNQIGEYSTLISLVKNKIVELISPNEELKKHYLSYYSKIMAKDSDNVSTNFNDKDFVDYFVKAITNKNIHILYGLDLEIRKKMESLEESKFIVNEQELLGIVENFTPGSDTITFKFDDGNKTGEKETSPNKKLDLASLISKLKEAYKKSGCYEEDHDDVKVEIKIVPKTTKSKSSNNRKNKTPRNTKTIKNGLKITPQSKTIYLREKNSLSIKVPKVDENGLAITTSFDSKDKGVASVNQNGVVKCLKPGKTEILVKFSNGLTSHCELTISDGRKPGEFTKEIFTKLLLNNQLSPQLISKLSEKNYCQKEFGISYAVITLSRAKENNKHYCPDAINGFYICTQWSKPEQVDKIKEWLAKNNLEI